MKTSSPENQNKYVALLRGINIGGHKKVPMADLRKALEKDGFRQVKTVLASGNIVFETDISDPQQVYKRFAATLANNFSFPIPLLLRSRNQIEQILTLSPFQSIDVTKDIRLYVTFLSEEPLNNLPVPYTSEDDAFQIIKIAHDAIFGVLDLSVTKTPDAMSILEKTYGKNITTRNWNTVVKIGKL